MPSGSSPVFVLSGETKRHPASLAPRGSHGTGRRSRLWRAGALLLGLAALILVTLLRPGALIGWLARRHPDILFQQATAERLVGLTVDDSPDPRWTPQILDVLAAHDAHATFFLIGERIPGNEGIVRRIVEEGHELGNHLMADAPSIRLSPKEFERQLQQTHALLAPYGPVRWLRPGSGWFSRRMLDQIQRHGYRCALGSSYAFDCQIRSAWYVARYILLTVRPGAVIVLHDGAPHGGRTVAVLRHVLPQLQQRGYRFVTLSELTEVEVGQRVDHTPVMG